MVLENPLLFADLGTIKYLVNCGSRRNRLAGIEPIPVRSGNTGWGTRRSSFALGSIEDVVIVHEILKLNLKLSPLKVLATPYAGVWDPDRATRDFL